MKKWVILFWDRKPAALFLDQYWKVRKQNTIQSKKKPKNICRLFESTMNELTIKRKQFQPENKRDLDDNSRSNINTHKSVLTQRNGCTNE